MDEIKEKVAYLTSEMLGLGQLPRGVAERLEQGAPLGEDLAPPPPFTTRPRLGARLVIQENFPRVAHALANELVAWQEGPRLHAVQLLEHMLFAVEDHAAAELHRILPAMLQVRGLEGRFCPQRLKGVRCVYLFCAGT